MRRKDLEITDRTEIEAILDEALVCRIGLSDGNDPYVVPVCFGYANGSVYIHSAGEGRKIALLKKNPRCCFEMDTCDGIVRSKNPCSWGMRYRSVIGSGTAAILTDPAEKQDGLTCILQHYGGGSHQFSTSDLEAVTVIRIAIETISGKKHE